MIYIYSRPHPVAENDKLERRRYSLVCSNRGHLAKFIRSHFALTSSLVRRASAFFICDILDAQFEIAKIQGCKPITRDRLLKWSGDILDYSASKPTMLFDID